MVFSDNVRFCFSVGDFIKVKTKYARIVGLFVHSRIMTKYMFIQVEYISPRTHGDQRELVLELPIYKLDGQKEIIGLPRIAPEKVWMVPRYDKSFLFIPFNIYLCKEINDLPVSLYKILKCHAIKIESSHSLSINYPHIWVSL